jgi:hypothetical protein
VNVERYDQTPELKEHEITALERNLPLLERGVLPCNVMRQARVDRVLEPVEDVQCWRLFQMPRPTPK